MSIAAELDFILPSLRDFSKMKENELKGGNVMPYVTVKMLPGRTVEQKRALIEKVTDAVSETTNAPKENITVFIEEMDATHYGQAGVMHADKK